MEFPTLGRPVPGFSDARTSTTSKSKAIFKGNVSWKFAPDNMLYTTVIQGYRRGGTNGTPTTGYFAEARRG